MINQSKLKAKTMKKIVLAVVVAMLCSLNLSAGELEDNIKKCDGGNTQACLKAAEKYYVAGKTDPKEIELFRKACNLNNAEACTLLAYKYKKSGDMANAKIFYTKACDLGDQVACTMK